MSYGKTRYKYIPLETAACEFSDLNHPVATLYFAPQNPENFASPIEVSERSDVFRKADVRRR